LSNPMRDATVTEQLVEWWSGDTSPAGWSSVGNSTSRPNPTTMTEPRSACGCGDHGTRVVRRQRCRTGRPVAGGGTRQGWPRDRQPGGVRTTRGTCPQEVHPVRPRPQGDEPLGERTGLALPRRTRAAVPDDLLAAGPGHGERSTGGGPHEGDPRDLRRQDQVGCVPDPGAEVPDLRA